MKNELIGHVGDISHVISLSSSCLETLVSQLEGRALLLQDLNPQLLGDFVQSENHVSDHPSGDVLAPILSRAQSDDART